jgi:hypothetical protein
VCIETYEHTHKNTKNSKQNANPWSRHAGPLLFCTPPTAIADSHQRPHGLRHAADRHRKQQIQYNVMGLEAGASDCSNQMKAKKNVELVMAVITREALSSVPVGVPNPVLQI